MCGCCVESVAVQARENGSFDTSYDSLEVNESEKLKATSNAIIQFGVDDGIL